MELSDQQRKVLNTLRQTSAWSILMEMFESEIASLRLPKYISKNKSYNDIAIEVIGKAYAVKKIEKILKTVNNSIIGSQANKPPMI